MRVEKGMKNSNMKSIHYLWLGMLCVHLYGCAGSDSSAENSPKAPSGSSELLKIDESGEMNRMDRTDASSPSDAVESRGESPLQPEEDADPSTELPESEENDGLNNSEDSWIPDVQGSGGSGGESVGSDDAGESTGGGESARGKDAETPSDTEENPANGMACETDEDCVADEVCESGYCWCSESCGSAVCGLNECGGVCGVCGDNEMCSEDGECTDDCANCPASTSCLNLSFESGTLDGWKGVGGVVVSEYDTAMPTDGAYMLLLSTAVETVNEEGDLVVGAANASFTTCMPTGESALLSIHWKAYSEEFVEWCGSDFQDGFEVAEQVEGGAWVPILDISIDDLCPPELCENCGELYAGLEPSGVALDQGDVHTTPWHHTQVGLGEIESDAKGTFRLRAKAGGDSFYHTVILVDDVRVETCDPNCDDKECGADGCGGFCGDCTESFECTDMGICCKPSCQGKQCGPDGCGGDCGECAPLHLCSGPGKCMGSCGNGVCEEEYGEDCVTCLEDCIGSDSCAETYCLPGYAMTCFGTCYTSFWLGDGFCDLLFYCEETNWDNGDCEPCIPSCEGKECGGDGCGGVCGSCEGSKICTEGACGQCVPSCDGKECGSDKCGDSCGFCSDDQVCSFNGTCGIAGCSSGDAPGCKGCSCEECVCEQDPFCCSILWDGMCVYECLSDACGGCPYSDYDSPDNSDG